MPNPKTAKRPDADRPLAAAGRPEPIAFGKNLVATLQRSYYGATKHQVLIAKRDLKAEEEGRVLYGRETLGRGA